MERIQIFFTEESFSIYSKIKFDKFAQRKMQETVSTSSAKLWAFFSKVPHGHPSFIKRIVAKCRVEALDIFRKAFASMVEIHFKDLVTSPLSPSQNSSLGLKSAFQCLLRSWDGSLVSKASLGSVLIYCLYQWQVSTLNLPAHNILTNKAK